MFEVCESKQNGRQLRISQSTCDDEIDINSIAHHFIMQFPSSSVCTLNSQTIHEHELLRLDFRRTRVTAMKVHIGEINSLFDYFAFSTDDFGSNLYLLNNWVICLRLIVLWPPSIHWILQKKISYLDVTFIYYEKCPTLGVYIITIGLETIGLITLDI